MGLSEMVLCAFVYGSLKFEAAVWQRLRSEMAIAHNDAMSATEMDNAYEYWGRVDVNSNGVI